MDSLSFSVIDAAHEWLEAGDRVYFATIISTWGASPRPPGSLFAYNASRNIQLGSLSGGCIEDELIAELCNHTELEYPLLKVYGDSPEDASRFQLPCGGTMTLIIEGPLRDRHAVHFRLLKDALLARELMQRRVSLISGDTALMAHASSASDSRVACDDEFMTHTIGPSYQLLIVGAGEVGRYLAPIAQSVDFKVELCDSRADHLRRHSAESMNIPVHLCLPDDLVNERFSDRYSAVVALAHDPRVDDLAVMAALESDCFYVGAMGSARTSERRISRLRELGFSQDKIDKLKAPIGLPIASKTPAEIAIAIAAELIKARNRKCPE